MKKSSNGQALSQLEKQIIKGLEEAVIAKNRPFNERFERCSSKENGNDEELLFYQLECVIWLQSNLLQDQGTVLVDQTGAGISVVLCLLSKFPKATTHDPFLVVASENSLDNALQKQWLVPII